MTDKDTTMAVAKREAFAALDRLTRTVGAAARAQLAKEHKAFQRARAIPDSDTLLLLLLFYTHTDMSLRVTAWFAHVGLGLAIRDQSLGDRFRQCDAWVRALVRAQLAATSTLAVPLRTRLRIVDGSVL
jgi:hypothetical protein